MHGLKTIGQLNELAVQNANAKTTLEKAYAVSTGKSPLADAATSAIAEREAKRQAIVASLAAAPIGELLGRVEALEYATTLELALAAKLKRLIPNGAPTILSDKALDRILTEVEKG